jgi:carbonic anhydrase/acetyltransferase-like protein (isoleucine patch superfamily)
MSSKYVVGTGVLLQWAAASWAEVQPELHLHLVDVGQGADYGFDLDPLEGVLPADASAFVAWGPQFLNFRRLELMGELKRRGFRMPPLICKGALVPGSVKIAENAAIGAGAIVGVQCEIGYNAVVGAGAHIGVGTCIEHSAWLAPGVFVGSASRVGAHATLGMGLLVHDGVHIGKQCVLQKPGPVVANVPAKTFHLASFADPVVVYGS